MNEPQAMTMAAKLAAFWPHIPEATVMAYAAGIADLNVAEMEDAVGFFATKSATFPSLKELREYVGNSRQPALPAMSGARFPVEVALKSVAHLPEDIRPTRDDLEWDPFWFEPTDATRQPVGNWVTKPEAFHRMHHNLNVRKGEDRWPYDAASCASRADDIRSKGGVPRVHERNRRGA